MRFRNASDSRAVARSAAGSPADTRNTADSSTSPDRLQAAAIVSEAHRRRRHVDNLSVARREARLDHEIANQTAAEMRVAEDRAADGARACPPRLRGRPRRD